VPLQHVEVSAADLQAVVPHEAGDFLVLAWHHNPLSYQAGAKQKRSHQREQAFCLACADGLLGDAFDTLNVRGFDQLDAMVRASSLVEMVNALLRPSRKSCQGQSTPETLNLIMLYPNHRRYKSGQRQGKAPIALLTGKPLQAPWWALLLHQVKTKQGVTSGALPSRPPLHLVIHTDGETNQPAMAPGQAIVEPLGASEKKRRHTDAEAA